MSSLMQTADSIIEEEKIDNSTPAVDPTPPAEEPEIKNNEQPPEKSDEPTPPTPVTTPTDPKPEDEDKEPEAPEEPEKEEEKEPDEKPEDGKTPTETVQEAKTLIENLQLTEDKIFDEQGNVKPWTEVVPAGAYLASQLEPISVTGKDGKTYEFMLIQDVEDKFPEGFEAKNNLEQMKFEKAIMNNEAKFDEAVKTYKDAEARYMTETGEIMQARTEQTQIANEYKAMADKGLVPKIDVEPSDPKFKDSAAVKELDKILAWRDAKNEELAKEGLGKISSLWVAKQLMDSEGNKSEKEDKAKGIDAERKEVASLSSSPAPTGKETDKKVEAPNVSMATFAEQIISAEGLR